MQNRSTELCNDFSQSFTKEFYANKNGLASRPNQLLLLKCELIKGKKGMLTLSNIIVSNTYEMKSVEIRQITYTFK